MSSSLLRTPAFRAAIKRSYATSSPTQKATEVASKATNAAEAAASKGKNAAGSAVERLQKSAGPMGDRAVKMVESVMNQTIAYTKLAGAVGKQVYIAEKMAPPTSLGEITSAVASVVGKARNAQYWQGLISSGEWKVVAFGSVQLYGLFKIGEILGKQKLVGYEIDHHHAEGSHH